MGNIPNIIIIYIVNMQAIEQTRGLASLASIIRTCCVLSPMKTRYTQQNPNWVRMRKKFTSTLYTQEEEEEDGGGGWRRERKGRSKRMETKEGGIHLE